MAVWVGGDKEAYTKVRPVLDASYSSVMYTGGLGTAMIPKVNINLSVINWKTSWIIVIINFSSGAVQHAVWAPGLCHGRGDADWCVLLYFIFKDPWISKENLV